MSAIRNKQRLLHLYRYLMENTDEEHQATTNDLVGFLKREDANASRKTVKDDIEVLIEEGVDIVTTKSYYNAYFIGNRQFELPEIKFIADGVAASISLSAEQKERIIEKLLKTLSGHQAQRIREGIVYSASSGNDQLYYNIDRISEAIIHDRKIGFQYFEYEATGDKVLSDDGKTYVLTPYLLTNNNNRFYVIGFCASAGTIAVFRLDRIAKARILDEEGDPVPDGLDLGEYKEALFDMQVGPLTEVVLECANTTMGEIVDKFGERCETWKSTADSFYVKTRVCLSAAFYAWVFMHGGSIRIISPAGVCNGYMELARKSLRQEKKK